MPFPSVPAAAPRGPRRYAASLALLVGSLLAACASVPQAPYDRLARAVTPPPIAETDWPQRSTVRLQRALDSLNNLPETLTVPVPIKTLLDGKPETITIEAPVMRVFDGGLYGRGLVFRLERVFSAQPPSLPDAPGLTMKFISYPPTRDERRALRDPADSPPGRGGGGPPGRADPWAIVQRGLWLRLYQPTEPIGGDTGIPSRGLVVHLSSFGGSNFEQPIIEDLLADGWSVLRIATPNLRPARGTPEVQINSDADFDHAARTIAAGIDDRLAEHAYAVEAALAYLAARRPDIPTRPLVLMAYSAGALVAPAVAARLPDRFDAAVLVCGGANLLDISQRSELTNGGIQVKWADGRGTPDDIARLSGLYLAYARLDPFHTAAYLTSTPVLQVHGAFDGIVPSDDGDLLYRRLNYPEKLTYPLGHKAIFWLLPSQARRLVDWVEQTTRLLPRESPTDNLSAIAPEPPRHAVP